MANITLNTIAGIIRLLPLRAARFSNSDGDYLDCYRLEEESACNLDEVTVPHYQGGEQSLGFNLDIQLVIPHNYFDENPGLIDLLEKFRGTRPMTHLFFGTSAPTFGVPLQIPPHVINATDGMEMHLEQNLTFSYEIRQVQFRPHCTIKLKGFIADLTKVPLIPGSETTFRMFDKLYPIVP